MMTDLKDLQEKVKALEDHLDQVKLAGDPTAAQKSRVMYKQRKLFKFSGKRTELEDLIREARAAIKAQGLEDQEAVDFLLTCLNGVAKSEVKFTPVIDRPDAEYVFKTLTDAFGERMSHDDLLDLFYARKQAEGESLRHFSHGLMSLLDRALERKANFVPDRDVALRDRFKQKVKDKTLRTYLKQLVRKDSTLTFKDLREEAIQYSEEDHLSNRKVSVHKVDANDSGDESEVSEIGKLKEVVAQQQGQIDSLIKSQQELIRMMKDK